jgi:hypothetical protein
MLTRVLTVLKVWGLNMHKLRRQAPSPSVLSIGGRQMKDRLDAPLTNARTQLIIQAFFMMVYTYALTHILLFAVMVVRMQCHTIHQIAQFPQKFASEAH